MRLSIFVMLCVMIPFAYAQQAVSPYVFKSPQDEVRFYELTAQLRCLVCQNQTLLDSDATLAKDLRARVYELVLSGRSNEEIIAYLTARYGDFILYQPPLNASTGILWFAPLMLLLIGCVVFIIIMKRARQRYKEGGK